MLPAHRMKHVHVEMDWQCVAQSSTVTIVRLWLSAPTTNMGTTPRVPVYGADGGNMTAGEGEGVAGEGDGTAGEGDGTAGEGEGGDGAGISKRMEPVLEDLVH